MGKFAETWSEQQRAAVVADALALGNNKEAMRRAHAGDLAAGLEPFRISYTYVCELVSEEKRRRDPEGRAAQGKTPGELADDILRRELRRLDALSRQNRLNPEKTRAMARALREIDALAKAKTTGSGNPDQGAGDTAEPEQPRSLLERLAAEAEKEATREPEQPSPRGDTSADTGSGEDTSTGSTIAGEQADEQASAVRSRADNLSSLRQRV